MSSCSYILSFIVLEREYVSSSISVTFSAARCDNTVSIRLILFSKCEIAYRSEESIAIVKKFDLDFFMFFDSINLTEELCSLQASAASIPTASTPEDASHSHERNVEGKES